MRADLRESILRVVATATMVSRSDPLVGAKREIFKEFLNRLSKEGVGAREVRELKKSLKRGCFRI